MSGRTAARLWVFGRLLNPLRWRGKTTLDAAPHRILVLHHLLLGDALMLTPLLAKLRQTWPAADILMACPRPLMPLYAARPFGVEAVPFDPRDRASVVGLQRPGGYDLCLVPAENRLVLLAYALNARHVRGFAADQPAWKNWLLDAAPRFPATPACFGDFAATLVAGAPPPAFRPAAWPWAKARAFALPQGRYAVLHLGASTPLKYWPVERWWALAEALYAAGIEPIWSAGAKETALVAQADPAGRFASCAGQLDLLQLAQLLRGAALLVCPDTGVAHLGRLTGTPTVALFGPGSPAVSGAGDYWRDSPFVALTEPIACRDQTVTFRRHAAWIQRCARSYGEGDEQCAQPRCMEAITFDTVLTACQGLLQREANDQG